MELGSILIGLSLVILAGAYIARPLIEQGVDSISSADFELSSMQAEQDRILALIEELEMDHAIGKILDEDYQAERAWLMQQGAENLKRIDAFQLSLGAPESPRTLASSLEDELEVSVAKLRSGASKTGRNFCSSCGTEINPSDNFCVNCGANLSIEEPGV